MLLPLLLALSAPDVRADDGGLAASWTTPAPSATWIVVLESGASLKASAEAAREPIARLVEALPPGDAIEIIGLHVRSSSILPRRKVDEAGRAALAEEIRKLEVASAKSSDLGAGLAALTSSVGTTKADRPLFVLFLGSFCHSPPLGSIWADGGYGCRAIRSFDKLQQAYDSGSGRDLVSATLFPVATKEQAVHEGGMAEVRAFFEPAGAVQVATEPFAAWIEAIRERLPDERLRPLARAEAARLALKAEVVKQPSMDDPRAELRLSTGFTNLGFDATRVTVDGARIAEGALHLAPTGTILVDVDVPEPPFSLVPRTDTVDIPVKVTLDGAIAPAGPLRGIGIEPDRAGLTADVTLHAERHYGLSAFRSAMIFASGFLLTGAVGLVVRRRVQPLRLGGTFSYRRAGGPKQTLAIENLAEAAIVVQADGSLATGRREDAVLVLRVERPLWKAHTTVEIRLPNAEINTRPVAPGRHTVVAGATSLQFRDYRLSWE